MSPPFVYSAYSTYTIVHTQYSPCPQANMMSDSIGNATLGKANKAFSSRYLGC